MPHLSLPLLRSLHPSRPLMPSSRVGGRGIRVDRVTVEGRTGAGPTEMAREILARPEWEAVWGAGGGGARLCSVCGRNWPGSTSRGWTTASFTRVWHTERERGKWGRWALRDKHKGVDAKRGDCQAAECITKDRKSDGKEKENISVAESVHRVKTLTTFLRCGPAVEGLRIRVHNFTSSGCVHLFWKGRRRRKCILKKMFLKPEHVSFRRLLS